MKSRLPNITPCKISDHWFETFLSKLQIIKSRRHCRRLIFKLTAFIFLLVLSVAKSFAAVGVTTPSLTVSNCGTFPTGSSTLGNIVISENLNGDISTFGTVVLTAPANFEFTSAGSATFSANGNVTDVQVLLNNASTITITILGSQTNKRDIITISGISIRGINTSSGPSNIIRTGGTSVIAGDANEQVHASLTSQLFTRPSVTTANISTICNGAGTNITLTSSEPSTFSWTLGAITGGITGASAGSGATINQILTNPSNSSSGSVVYNVTPVSTSGCSGTTYPITVTVNPRPNVTTANTAVTCNGTGPNIILTSSTPSSFNWTIGAITGNITGASAGSGSTINQTLTNPSNSTAGSVVYIVTPTSTSGSCIGTPYPITITVNPTPAVTSSNSTSICSGAGPNINLQASVPSSFTWTIGTTSGGITGATAGSGSIINQILTNPSNSTSGSVEYIVTPTSSPGGCSGAPYSIIVTVNPTPVIVDQPSTTNQTLCRNASAAALVVTTSVTGLSYQWYSNSNSANTGGTIISGATSSTYMPQTTAPGTLYYYVVISGSCTTSFPSNVSGSVTVNDLPAISTSPSAVAQTLCINSPASPLSVTASGTGATYQWYSNATASTSGGTLIDGATGSSYSPITSTPGTLYYYVIVSGICSPAATSAISGAVTVNNKLDINLEPTSQTTCSITDVTFKVGATGTGALTYTWYKQGNPIPLTNNERISGATTSEITFSELNALNSGNYFVVVSDASGCPSIPSQNALLTVNQEINVVTQPAVSQTLCEGSTATFNVSANGTGPFTVNWYNGGGAPLVNSSKYAIVSTPDLTSTPNTVTTSLQINGILLSDASNRYYVIISSSTGACPNEISDNAALIVTPKVGTPTNITINGGTEPTCQIVNSTTSTSYATTATSNTGLNWSISDNLAGAINASTGVMTWANGFFGTVDIQVTATGCDGISPQVIKTVVISPSVTTPVFALGATSERCQGAGTVTYAATADFSTGGITYSLDAATLAFAGNTIAPTTGEVTFAAGWSGTTTVAAVAQGCNGPVTELHTVTVKPTVGVPVFALGATSTRCQGAGNVTYTASSTNYTGIIYSLDAPSFSGGNTIVASTGAVSYAAGWSGTTTITASAAGCNGPATSLHTVTVTPTVGAPVFTLGATSTRCQGAGTITYTATASTNTGITYALDATTRTFPGNSINPANGEVIFAASWSGTSVISASAAGCSGPSTAIHTVTITPTVGTPTAIIVSAGTEPTCKLTNGTTTTTYSTTATNNTGFEWSLSIPAAGSITSDGVMTWANGFSGTVFIMVKAKGCNGPSATVVRRVTMNPPFVSTITATPLTSICLGQSVTLTASGFDALGTISGGTFSQANPEGWSAGSASNSNGADDSDWGEVAPTNNLYNGLNYYSGAPSGPKFMIVNGITDASNKISYLSSPIFSTVGRTSATLEWYQGYNFKDGAIGRVEISTDGGATYTILRQYDKYSPAVPIAPFTTKVSIDINEYLGLENLVVRFYYIGTAGSNWAIDDVNTGGNYQPVTYGWTAATGLSASGSVATVTPIAAGTFEYTVTTSTGGCTSTISKIQIIVNPLPTLGGNTSVCIGSTTQLAGSGTAAVVASNPWVSSSPGIATVSNTGLVTGVSAGTSVITYTNSNGCKITTPITVNPRSTAVLTGTTSVCDRGPVTLSIVVSGSGPVSGTLSDGTAFTGTAPNISVSVNPTATTTYTIASMSNTFCSSNPVDITGSAIITVNTGYIWTGAAIPDNRWTTKANWICEVPPNEASVIIPDVPNKNYPLLNVDFTSDNFDLLGAATIQLNGKTLTLGYRSSSSINLVGSIVGSDASSLSINGILTTTLKFQPIPLRSANALKNLTFNSAGNNIVLGNSLYVFGNVVPTKGTLSSNGFLTMVSTVNTTSNIGSLATGAAVAGIVNVESWLTGGSLSFRNTRTMSSPVSGAPYKQLQTDMIITGTGTGFDDHPPDPGSETLYTYNETARIDAGAVAQYNRIPDINNIMVPGSGFFILFRGNRTIDNSTAAGTKVTAPYDHPESLAITYKGPINSGDFNIGLSYTPNTGLRDVDYNGFNLVGNPYPSTIDWTKVVRSDNSVVENMVSIIRPGGGMRTYSGGIVVNGGTSALPGGAVAANPNDTPEIPFYIQPGQGFYVRTRNTGTSITFSESSKVISVGNLPVAPHRLLSNSIALQKSVETQVLRVNLQDNLNTDETAIVFKEGFEASFGSLDATYFAGSSVSLSSLTSDGKSMAINFMPELIKVNEVKLVINSTTSGNVKLNFPNVSSFTTHKVILKDLFLNTFTDVKANPVYAFALDKKNSATFGANRFVVIFEEMPMQTVKYLSFTGHKLNNGSELRWSTENEFANDYFEIEHSSDGNTFIAIGKVKGGATSAKKLNYSFVHKTLSPGVNYYRLKEVNFKAQSAYSKVIAINIEGLNSEEIVTLFPNPARNEFNLKIDPLVTNIQLNIYDMSSNRIKPVINKSVTNPGLINQNISNLESGVYIVEILDLSTNKVLRRLKLIKE